MKYMVIMAMLYFLPNASLATVKTSKGIVHTFPIQEVFKEHQDASRGFNDGSRRL